MTPAEARRRAVAAAAEAIFNESGTARLQSWERYRAFYAERGVLSPDYYAQAEAAVLAAERAMADAGWRWARDCGDSDSDACLNPSAGDYDANPSMAYDDGWNAARAAMLGEGE